MITSISTENCKGFIDRDDCRPQQFMTKLNVSSFQLWSPVSSRVTFILPHPMQGHYQRTSVDGEKFSFHLTSLSLQKHRSHASNLFYTVRTNHDPTNQKNFVDFITLSYICIIPLSIVITNVIQPDKCWINCPCISMVWLP